MYVKITDGVIEEAPQNKDSIINYNLDIDLMISDGYKLFVPAKIPPQTNRMYHYEYIETVDEIQETIVYDETQEEADAREAQQEAERKAKLKMTKREVFLTLYKDKGITPEQIKAQITSPEALIEFEYANDYFRGNPLINLIGNNLGYTPEQLDYLFEHKELENG